MGDLGSIPGLGISPGEGKTIHSNIWPREFHGLYSPWSCKDLEKGKKRKNASDYFVSVKAIVLNFKRDFKR